MNNVNNTREEYPRSGELPQKALKTVSAAGLFVALVSTGVIYGWFIKSVAIVQISSVFVPMQFNTALLFLLSAFGLLAGNYQKPRLAASLGVCVVLFAFATLLQYPLQKDFHIDQFFMKAFTTVKTSHPGRMSPQSAFNFILTGLGLFMFIRTKPICLKVRFFLSACILTLSLGALLGYMFNIECAYGIGALTRMALHTSLCFSILSLGLMSFTVKANRNLWPVIGIFSSGLLISLFILQIVLSTNEKQLKLTFENDSRDRILAFKRQVEIVERVLHSVRAFYEGSNSVEREEFAAFVHRVIEGMSSVQAVEWSEKITQEQRAEYEKRLGDESDKSFPMRELDGSGAFILAGQRPDYYPVTYTEPYNENIVAMGFDHGADPRRREAIEMARDENKTQVTVPLHLFRESDPDARGLLVFEPVYKNDADLASLESRRENFKGALTAVIRVPHFMERTLAYVTPEPLEIFIFDVSRSDQPFLAYGIDSDFSEEQMLDFARNNFRNLSGNYYTEKIVFAGAEYQILVRATSAYLERHQTWFPVLTFFILLAGTLGATLFTKHTIARNIELQAIAGALKTANITSEATRSRLQAILDSATDVSIIATDTQGIIKVFNKGAEKMLGWKAAEMIDLNTPQLIHAADEVFARGRELSEKYGRPIEGFDVFVEAAKQGSSDENEWTYVRKDGSYLAVNLVVTAVYDSQKRLAGFLGIAVDISERKRMMEELKKVSAAALEASRAKSEFLATMSHEIRTPMNAILGMAELLAETELNDEQRHFVEALTRGGETLLALINDVLDLSKIESGIIEIEETAYCARELIERITEVMAIAAHRKGVELTGSIASDVPEFLKGDPARIRQILMNLLGNAIKFTDAGEVSAELKKEGERLVFSVRDTGIGIPENKLESIFEPFTQADSSTTRKYGGTGLGLSISKKLVHLMGGELKVESRPGKGSRFYFELPLKAVNVRPEDAAVLSEIPPVLLGKSVLIVDDNETNRMILRKAVEHWGMKAWEASGGQEAIDLVSQRSENNQSFDLIIIDGHMPDMNGFQTAAKLKEDASLRASMIMMLTSDNRSGDADKARSLGFEAHLVKPVSRAQLLKVIGGIFLKQAPGGQVKAAAKPKAAVPEENKKILVAEDAIDNQELMKAYLKNQPYEVDLAENGKIAVEKATMEKYDLILMDMQMPEMDGYMATQLIRANEKNYPRGEKVKIVALTANALEKDAEKCLAAGCDAYLSKPIKKAVLLAALNQYLGAQAA